MDHINDTAKKIFGIGNVAQFENFGKRIKQKKNFKEVKSRISLENV
jgi:hypothetical protein